MKTENIPKTIKGTEYLFGYLMTSKCVVLIGKLTKLIAPSFGEMISSPTGNIADMDATRVLQLFADRLDPEQILEISKDLCSVVMKRASDGNGGILPIDFEREFQGEPGKMFEVAAQSLEVNAGDFFGAIREKLDSAKKKVTTPA